MPVKVRDYKEDKSLIGRFIKEYNYAPVVTGNPDGGATGKQNNRGGPNRNATHVADNDDDDIDIIKRRLQNEENRVPYPYQKLLSEVARHERQSMPIELDDIKLFENDLFEAVIANTVRYYEIFCEIIDQLLPEYEPDKPVLRTKLDIFMQSRLQIERAIRDRSENYVSPIPPSLKRNYRLCFKAAHVAPLDKPIPIRHVKAHHIGKLIIIRGVIVRATEVKPLMTVATYWCANCSSEVFQEVKGPQFTPLLQCQSEKCKTFGSKGKLRLQSRACRFSPFREIRIQEASDAVPVGNIPRSVTVHVNGEELTAQGSPGDTVQLVGIYLPEAKIGFRQMQMGLMADTYVEALDIKIVSKSSVSSDDSSLRTLDGKEIESVVESREHLYDRLASSIAPEIYGSLDIKKVLLLMLIGGVDAAPRGMKIRGGINVCLMGDPGVAKSQLLAFVDRLAPRSQYTTGRGSSGVGLTAAVMKDPLTNEMVLEGGALVLADGGICCIDEFDKMMDADRTAIHEVMEQQTVSIAKAGILTTLNARVSILAAANPAFSRYNPRKSLEENIQLPAALLSRFDVLWLIRDKPDYENDSRLARHITTVHRTGQHPQQAADAEAESQDAEEVEKQKAGGRKRRRNGAVAETNGEDAEHHEGAAAEAAGTPEFFSMDFLRRYIATAQQYTPTIPPALVSVLTNAYVEMRKAAQNDKKQSTFTSPRSLLALIRLSTALARLRLSSDVTREDVNEALRLMEMSKASLLNGAGGKGSGTRGGAGGKGGKESNTAKIFNFIKDMFQTGDVREISVASIHDRLRARGFRQEEVDEAVEDYEEMGIWNVSNDHQRLILIG